ncbi:hypothetical protein [Amycolatopsis sp. lyj-346]
MILFIRHVVDVLPAVTVGLRALAATISLTVAADQALRYWRGSRDR